MKKIKILMSLLIILSLLFVQTTLTYSSSASPKNIVFSPNGTPLVAAHSNDVFGANWKWSEYYITA